LLAGSKIFNGIALSLPSNVDRISGKVYLITCLSHTPGCASVHRILMRRLVASFVVSVFAWSFVAPLALGLAADKTPMCCRRSGEHRCTAGNTGISISGDNDPSVRSLPTVCPHRSEIAHPPIIGRVDTSRTTVHYLPSAIRCSEPEFISVASHSLGQTSQRGPPASLLFR